MKHFLIYTACISFIFMISGAIFYFLFPSTQQEEFAHLISTQDNTADITVPKVIKKQAATVMITSSPPGAEIFENDKPTGFITPINVVLPWGSVVDFKLNGFKAQTKYIGPHTTSLHVCMEPDGSEQDYFVGVHEKKPELTITKTEDREINGSVAHVDMHAVQIVSFALIREDAHYYQGVATLCGDGSFTQNIREWDKVIVLAVDDTYKKPNRPGDYLPLWDHPARSVNDQREQILQPGVLAYTEYSKPTILQ